MHNIHTKLAAFMTYTYNCYTLDIIHTHVHNMHIPTIDLLSAPNAHRQDDSVGRVNWASPHRDSPYAPNNPTWANLLKSALK